MGLITFLTSCASLRLMRRPPATGLSRPAPGPLRESMWLTVSSSELARLRQRLGGPEGGRIECCIPWPADGRVQIRISHLPGQARALRQRLAPALTGCAWPPCGADAERHIF